MNHSHASTNPAGPQETVGILRGRCWKFGDNIPTDHLVKSHHIFEPMEVIAQHVLEDHDPTFAREVQPGDVLVVGFHFGQSSGRAMAAKAVQATGVSCVVADRFARTFYRNCFEIGLPVVELPGVTDLVQGGEQVEVDIRTGRVVNLATGEERVGEPTHPFLVDMLEAGGLIPYVAQVEDFGE